MDHIRRNTLNLSELKAIVLDEADEMLRMGFIDDVETVMAELPEEHQTACSQPPCLNQFVVSQNVS